MWPGAVEGVLGFGCGSSRRRISALHMSACLFFPIPDLQSVYVSCSSVFVLKVRAFASSGNGEATYYTWRIDSTCEGTQRREPFNIWPQLDEDFRCVLWLRTKLKLNA